jgi:hypothetical protein
MMIGVRPFLRCCYGHYPKHRKYIAINHGITEDLLIDSKSKEGRRCHSSSTATATSATINLIRQQNEATIDNSSQQPQPKKATKFKYLLEKEQDDDGYYYIVANINMS